MQHVLHVITSSGRGGAERMLYKLTKGAQVTSHSVICLTEPRDFGRLMEENDVSVYYLNATPGGYDFWVLKDVIRIIRQEQPDVIQGWMYHGNVAALLGNGLSGWFAPTLWNVRHSLHDIRYEKWSTQLFIRAGIPLSRLPCCVLYNSERSASQHVDLGYTDSNVHLVPNGFDCEKYQPDAEKRAHFRNELEASDDQVLVGHVAAYQPMKDHANFVRAAGVLGQQFDNLRFVMVGRGVNTENEELRSIVDQVGQNCRISLLGLRSDIPSVMNGIDVLVLSSAWGEAFPNVLGEAMACGTPCVATDVGDTPQIIGDTGWIVPTNDPNALANAIAEFTQQTRSRRFQLGQQARSRVLNRYSLRVVVSQYEELYYEAAVDTDQEVCTK